MVRMKPRLLARLGALLATFALAACGPGAGTGTGRPLVPVVASARDTGVSLDEQAAAAAQRGVLDVAAHLLGKIAERDGTAEAKIEHARALADTWAFEQAARVLDAAGTSRAGDETARRAAAVRATIPAFGSVPVNAEVVDQALSAFAAKDAAKARDLLAPLVVPGAHPSVIALLGRAQAAAGGTVAARRSFARARCRVGASGGSVGLVAAEAAAVEHVALERGRLVLARRRDLRLAGGYEAMNDFGKWIEVISPGDPEPLLRVPTGHVEGMGTGGQPPIAAVVDRPLGYSGARGTGTLRILDARTGGELSSAEVALPHLLVLSAERGEIAVAAEDTLRLWDLEGKELRRVQLTGKTPGIIRAYTGQGTHHHNIPTEYASRAVHLERDADGTLLAAASDGSVWIVGPGAASPVVLPPPRGRPADVREAMASQALDLHRDGDSITAVYGDGSIFRWDVRTKRKVEVAPPRCVTPELAEWSFDPGKPVDASKAAECAAARLAAISPDGARVILGGGFGGMRVRAARDGGFVATIATLAREGIACTDAACSRAWIAGVDGRVELWDTSAGKRAWLLPQGGVAGFLRGVSADGRFVVIDEATDLGYKVPPRVHTRIWDTVAGAEVKMPEGYELGALSGSRPVLIATAEGRDALLFDLEARRKITTFSAGKGEWFELSADGRRTASVHERAAIVREAGRELRRLEMRGQIHGLSMSRDGRRVCLRDENSDLSVFDAGTGEVLFQRASSFGGVLSADGAFVALRIDPLTAAVVELATGRELGRVSSAELKQDVYPESIRDVGFTGRGTELALVGPGAPGYSRLYLWRPGEDARPTEVQLLSTVRILPAGEGVLQVFDRNDSAHLVRLADGKLLASVYSARNGWVAQSPAGAVDGPEQARGAFVTFTEGLSKPIELGASVAWDRFHTPGLLAQAARGELPAPPMPGPLRLTETLRAARR